MGFFVETMISPEKAPSIGGHGNNEVTPNDRGHGVCKGGYDDCWSFWQSGFGRTSWLGSVQELRERSSCCNCSAMVFNFAVSQPKKSSVVDTRRP